jgi:hypothetical protein
MESGEFEKVTLYRMGYACLLRDDCRHLKFWWGPWEKSTSQHYDRVLHFVYTLKGKRNSEHKIECHGPIYAVIVDTRHAIDPPSSHVKDPDNPWLSNQRYSYNDPRIGAGFDELLAAKQVPLLADFRGLQLSEEIFHSTLKAPNRAADEPGGPGGRLIMSTTTETGQVYADPTDFPGLLRRIWDLRLKPSKCLERENLQLELVEIRSSVVALDALRVMFERLEAGGVRLPTVYWMTGNDVNDCGPQPKPHAVLQRLRDFGAGLE